MSDLIKLTRNLLEEKDLGQGVKIKTYESKNKERIFGEVSACVGRLVVERTYQNNFKGKKELEAFLGQFKTSNDVFEYFNIDKEEINMNLESLAKEIEKNRKYAEEKIEGGNPATLNTRLSRKRSAQYRLEELYTQYRLILKDHLVFIVPVGSGASKFVEITQEMGLSVSNADSFYEDLANRIPVQYYNGKQTQSSLVDVFTRHLEDKAQEIGVRSYPVVAYTRKYSKKISGKKELLEMIKRLINEDVGSEIVAMQILNEVATAAMKEGFGKGKLPVVVSIQDQTIAEQVIAGLKVLSPHVAVVGTGKTPRGGKKSSLPTTVKLDEVNAESVEGALAEIRKKVR